ncbi:hypothetical protein F5146DRAFT_978197 [Armillaria mellea]|nr:hypothetical protein F5146DRAFT_978197 [Armillaria mellea]
MSTSEHVSEANTSPSEQGTSSEAYQPIDFDKDGEWDDDEQSGPAIHAPQEIKNIAIKNFRVEWLNLSDPSEDFYAKNHMVGTVTFVQPHVINGARYSSARISMEVGVEKKFVAIVGQEEWMPGSHYFHGVYTLNLLDYAEPTHRAVHHLTFPLRQGTTIGTLIDKVVQRNMHHFLFLPYTAESRWKGCGDHLLHTWALFVREGDITSAKSIENPTQPLCEELTSTYIEGGRKTWERIGRGWWVSHNPKEDEFTPETTFTDRRPTYQLTPNAAGQD